MRKIKYKRPSNVSPIKEIVGGNWVDLRVPKDTYVYEKKIVLINLGFALELPDGIEAIMVTRSSSFNKYGITLVNSPAVIDDIYRGDGDYWRAQVKGHFVSRINENDRVFQFRLQPKMNATPWQKIRFLFSRFKFVEVESFNNNNNRGGIGSTGVD